LVASYLIKLLIEEKTQAKRESATVFLSIESPFLLIYEKHLNSQGLSYLQSRKLNATKALRHEEKFREIEKWENREMGEM